MEYDTGRLVAMRMSRSFSQAELARVIGISVPYLSQLERGKRRFPNVQIISKIAVALKLTADELNELKEFYWTTSRKIVIELEEDPPKYKVSTLNHLAEKAKTLTPIHFKAIRAILEFSA